MSEGSGNRNGGSQVSTVDLMVIIIIVLLARIVIERVMPLFYESFGLYFGDFLFQTLSNYSLTFGALLGDILAVVLLVRFFPYGSGRTIVRSLVLFLFTYVSNFVFNAVAILVTDLIFYYRWTNRKAVAVEAEQRAKANYQYQLLKSETNPHFLFNCLNVLQYLIHEDADRASDYAGKLAGVYRYFLKLEKHTLVMLEEELEFVRKYCDLLRERFGESFVTEIDIPGKYHDARIIPCTLQMMVENAVKHNVVNSSNVLRISIGVELHHIVVRNNLNPKKADSEISPGTGLQNISRQYEILFSRSVVTEKTDSEFIVRIPLVR